MRIQKIIPVLTSVSMIGAFGCGAKNTGAAGSAAAAIASAKPASGVTTRVGSLATHSKPGAPSVAQPQVVAASTTCVDPYASTAGLTPQTLNQFTKGTWRLVGLSLYSIDSATGESFAAEGLPGELFRPRVSCTTLKPVAVSTQPAAGSAPIVSTAALTRDGFVNAADYLDLLALKSSPEIVSASVIFQNGRMADANVRKIPITPADLTNMPNNLGVQTSGGSTGATAELFLNSKGQMEIRAQATLAEGPVATLTESFRLVYELEH